MFVVSQGVGWDLYSERRLWLDGAQRSVVFLEKNVRFILKTYPCRAMGPRELAVFLILRASDFFRVKLFRKNQKQEDSSSMPVSELKEVIYQAVNESNAPLRDKLGQIEERLHRVESGLEDHEPERRLEAKRTDPLSGQEDR